MPQRCRLAVSTHFKMIRRLYFLPSSSINWIILRKSPLTTKVRNGGCGNCFFSVRSLILSMSPKTKKLLRNRVNSIESWKKIKISFLQVWLFRTTYLTVTSFSTSSSFRLDVYDIENQLTTNELQTKDFLESAQNARRSLIQLLISLR